MADYVVGYAVTTDQWEAVFWGIFFVFCFPQGGGGEEKAGRSLRVARRVSFVLGPWTAACGLGRSYAAGQSPV